MTTDLTTLPPDPNASFVLPVDREHNGIRAAGCGIMLLVAALTFGIAAFLFNLAAVFALMIAFVAAIAATSLAENMMKGRWPSGRQLVATEQQIALFNRG
ncbi:MAG: hypothetical protein KC496_17660, partial [Anaerolineae bacterium]|nr:hypothetical protein [Anaerolineae bacterium]